MLGAAAGECEPKAVDLLKLLFCIDADDRRFDCGVLAQLLKWQAGLLPEQGRFIQIGEPEVDFLRLAGGHQAGQQVNSDEQERFRGKDFHAAM